MIEIPQHLIDQIAAGRCVAFVGAGFAAPAVPAWKALLEGLAEKANLDPDLVLIDWPLAVETLTTMRSQDLRAPSIVIARGDGGPPDRTLALSLGATDAVEEWSDLFREIDRLFD